MSEPKRLEIISMITSNIDNSNVHEVYKVIIVTMNEIRITVAKYTIQRTNLRTSLSTSLFFLLVTPKNTLMSCKTQ